MLQVNTTVFDEIPQYTGIKLELGIPPMAEEVKSAIASMAYKKAPGQSGIMTDISIFMLTASKNF